MIKENPLKFDLQIFALPDSATLGADNGVVNVSGSDETETYSFSKSISNRPSYAASITSSEIESAITTIKSGSWIRGGGESSDNLSLDGIADIKNFESEDAVQLSADGNTLNLNGVSGSVELENFNENSLAQEINGSNIDATFEDNAAVTLTAENQNSVEIAAEGNVTLNSVDENQTWNVDANNAVNFGGVAISANENISAKKSKKGEFLNVNSDNDATFGITAENAEVDKVEINGAVVGGMDALNGSNISTSDKEISAENLTAGKVSVDDWNLNLNDGDTFAYNTSKGNISVSSDYDNAVTIEGAADKTLTLNQGSNDISAKVNGANIALQNDAEGVEVKLEDGGISAISNVDEGAAVTVSGDDSFKINSKYNVTSKKDFVATVESNGLNVTAANGDNVSVGGGTTSFELSSGKATLNGEIIQLSAEDNANLTMKNSDLTAVNLTVGDTLTTATDKIFKVTYDASNVAANTDYVLTVNDTSISVKGSDFTGDTATLEFTSNGTIKIDGIKTDTTIAATKGTYKVNNKSAVTVNEDTGYITINEYGDVSEEDASVVDQKAARNSVVGAAESKENNIPAVDAYSNIGTSAPSAVRNSQVAHYDNATDTTPTATSIEGGINISVNTEKQLDSTTTLGDTENLRHVKLESSLADDIIIAEPEGDSIYSSIIDVSGSTKNTLVAVGTGDETSFVRHTIIGSGSDKDSYIILGENLRAASSVQAGDGNNYIYNAGARSTLNGGKGNDSVLAGKNDIVTGGAGKDYFFDSNDAANSGGYTVTDYNISDGDVIVATNLSKDETISSKMFDFKEGAVAISGGNQITLGGGENQALFTDSSTEHKYKLMWADKYGGDLNAEGVFATDSGVIMVADYNNRADTITGTARVDRIFAGGNDVVEGGDGKDRIFLTAAEGNEYGAAVLMSENTKDSKEVYNWSYGFDKADNKIFTDINSLTFTVTEKGNLYVANSESALVLMNEDGASTDKFNLLAGTDKNNLYKVTVVKNKANGVIENNDECADGYYATGDRATLTFGEGVTKIIDFVQDSETTVGNFRYVAFNNNSKSTMIGSDGEEYVTLGGAASKYANKVVSLGGGDDKIYSGGADTSTAGHTILFGAGDGNDSISNFGYYQGKKADFLKNSSDVISISGWDYTSSSTGISSINVTANKITAAIDSETSITLIDEVSTDNMLRIQLDGTEHIAKFGLSDNKQGNEFIYNSEVDFYYGDVTHKNDKLIVDSSTSTAEIYIDGSQGKRYYGIKDVDATGAKGRVIVYGNYLDNVLTSGGQNATLWGGEDASNDTLIGSDARDTFIFSQNGGNDKVQNFDKAIDKILMKDINIEDLAAANFNDDNSISIELTDGSNLTVESSSSLDGARFVFANNSYHAKKADDGSISWK